MKTKYLTILVVLVFISVFLYLLKGKLGELYYVLRNDFNYPEIEMVELPKSNLDVNFNERIWLHRVNDLNKLDYAIRHFTGVELDVMYDTNKKVVDIYYWPNETSKGLYLSEYIEHIVENNNNLLVWLDFKNLHTLSEQQIKEAISYIEAVLEMTNYPKKNIIVESPNAMKLAAFINAGFICSYWIPHIKTNFLSSRDIKIWQNQLSDEILKYNISLISFDVSMMSLVNRYFPNISHMVWGLNSNLKGILIQDLNYNTSHIYEH